MGPGTGKAVAPAINPRVFRYSHGPGLLRGVNRGFGVSIPTWLAWIKKIVSLTPQGPLWSAEERGILKVVDTLDTVPFPV